MATTDEWAARIRAARDQITAAEDRLAATVAAARAERVTVSDLAAALNTTNRHTVYRLIRRGDAMLDESRYPSTREVIDALNSYTGDDVWADVILTKPVYNTYDSMATDDMLGDCGRLESGAPDAFIIGGPAGDVIRYDHDLREWSHRPGDYGPQRSA